MPATSALRHRHPPTGGSRRATFIQFGERPYLGALPAGRRRAACFGEPGGLIAQRPLKLSRAGAGAHLGGGAFCGGASRKAAHAVMAASKRSSKIAVAPTPKPSCAARLWRLQPAGRRRTQADCPQASRWSWQLDCDRGESAAAAVGNRLIGGFPASSGELLSFSNWLQPKFACPPRDDPLFFLGKKKKKKAPLQQRPRQVRRGASTSQNCLLQNEQGRLRLLLFKPAHQRIDNKRSTASSRCL